MPGLTTPRPEPYKLSEEDKRRGYWWRAAPATPAFRDGWVLERPTNEGTGTPAADRCRYMVPDPRQGFRSRSCKEPAVAWLARSTWRHSITSSRWFAYCKDHLYGGWLVDGEWWRWHLETEVDRDGRPLNWAAEAG